MTTLDTRSTGTGTIRMTTRRAARDTRPRPVRAGQTRPGGPGVVRPGVLRHGVVRPGPMSSRPGGAAVQYRGAGVLMSRASHRRRPITPLSTVLLALIAAGITVWLGLVAQLGGVVGAESAAESGEPTRLAVVQVQSGESLQQVAQRVAPQAPVARTVERIRELNQLESSALGAGQTLVAPIG